MKNQQNVPVKSEAIVDGVPTEALVMYGSAVKARDVVDGFGILEGYGVVFDTSGNPEARDLSGQYFSAKTYLGPQNGDGACGTFHHMLPIKGMPAEVADHLFAPIKANRDDVGLFVQIVCDMSDDYEAAVYKMGKAGKLGFSSGTAAHMIKVADDGEILRWPIVEMALTPTPCEPRARATAMKALEAETGSEAMAVFASEFKAIFESQEQAEEAFIHVIDHLDAQVQENWRLQELASIQREALLLHADILRMSTSRY
ncbi:hypothetical protein EON83_25825 [bacterium]|nr:MAG: hypothetical protein EON83_25825 [bacterium]